jgi:hypothetical protein
MVVEEDKVEVAAKCIQPWVQQESDTLRLACRGSIVSQLLDSGDSDLRSSARLVASLGVLRRPANGPYL